MSYFAKPLADLFWRRVIKKGDNDCWEFSGCWNWKADKDSKGYGIIGVGIKTKRAYRLSWELKFGKIPEGLLVCHKCDTPSCVNPQHLFLGTNKDNQMDCERKGRRVCFHGELCSSHKVTEKDVVEIRRLRNETGATFASIARKYPVNALTISRIVRYKTWQNVE